jgi:hypothetical protein
MRFADKYPEKVIDARKGLVALDGSHGRQWWMSRLALGLYSLPRDEADKPCAVCAEPTRFAIRGQRVWRKGEPSWYGTGGGRFYSLCSEECRETINATWARDWTNRRALEARLAASNPPSLRAADSSRG